MPATLLALLLGGPSPVHPVPLAEQGSALTAPAADAAPGTDAPAAEEAPSQPAPAEEEAPSPSAPADSPGPPEQSSSPPSAEGGPASGAGPLPAAAPSDIEDGVVVLYFHLTLRCPDCILIQNYTRDVIEIDFPEALEEGRLEMQVLDVEKSENAVWVEHYGAEGTTLVLSRREGGEEVEIRVLDAVWDLVGDSMSFADYVRDEISAMLMTP